MSAGEARRSSRRGHLSRHRPACCRRRGPAERRAARLAAGWEPNPSWLKGRDSKAARLAELVRVATELPTAKYSTPVAMPANYAGAIVLSAFVVTEPYEVPDDPSGFARVSLDLVLEWARA